LPKHDDFQRGFTRKRVRTVLAASKKPLRFSPLLPAEDPTQIVDPWSNKWAED